jgi:hypothetical protein
MGGFHDGGIGFQKELRGEPEAREGVAVFPRLKG